MSWMSRLGRPAPPDLPPARMRGMRAKTWVYVFLVSACVAGGLNGARTGDPFSLIAFGIGWVRRPLAGDRFSQSPRLTRQPRQPPGAVPRVH